MCAKVVNDFYDNYSLQMNRILDENKSGLLDNDEVSDCHQHINSKIIIALRVKLKVYQINLLWQTFE